MEERKPTRLAEFLEDNQELGTNIAFEKALVDLMGIKTVMEGFVLDGKVITEYEIYKTHAPEFKKIYAKMIDNPQLLSSFNVPQGIINEMKKPDPDRDKIVNAFEQAFDIDLKQGIDADTLINKIGFRMLENPEIDKDMKKQLYFEQPMINQIKGTIELNMKLFTEIKTVKSELIKHYTFLNMHRDSYELYRKILHNIWEKLHDPSEKSTPIAWIKDNHSLLWEDVDHDLRTDTSHLLFKDRWKYTEEELKEKWKINMVKSITALNKKVESLVHMFEGADESINT